VIGRVGWLSQVQGFSDPVLKVHLGCRRMCIYRTRKGSPTESSGCKETADQGRKEKKSCNRLLKKVLLPSFKKERKFLGEEGEKRFLKPFKTSEIQHPTPYDGFFALEWERDSSW